MFHPAGIFYAYYENKAGRFLLQETGRKKTQMMKK